MAGVVKGVNCPPPARRYINIKCINTTVNTYRLSFAVRVQRREAGHLYICAGGGAKAQGRERLAGVGHARAEAGGGGGGRGAAAAVEARAPQQYR